MKIFLAGQNQRNKIIRLVHNEDLFSGGESRHWLYQPYTIKDENILCRQHDFPTVYSSDVIKGGYPQRKYIWPVWHRGEAGGYDKTIQEHKPYILESFYYTDEDTERLLPYFGDFMLDSGAFTFMQNSKMRVNWEEYIERYAVFIIKNKIEKFFELDIDNVVGYSKVLQYRSKLERLVGRPCIPVWHKSRGIDDFKNMCDQYSYVAIGGIVSKEIKPEQYKAFPMMINEAHRRKAKIHGLGFTTLKFLPKIHFDSVDSTAWTTGNRFGFVYRFNGETMEKVDVPKGKRLRDAKKVALINYIEWIKFQKYAEHNL